jgi:hypothetical protein
MAKTEEGIHTWRKYLAVHDDGSKAARDPENIIASKETQEPSPPADVSSTNFLALSGGAQKVETNRFGIHGRQPFFGLTETSSEYLTEQLLEDLDNAAAKVRFLQLQASTLVTDCVILSFKCSQRISNIFLRRNPRESILYWRCI